MALKKELGQNLQDNILTLLCFDKESVSILANNLDPKLFSSSIYRHVADESVNFYYQYNTPIGEHLPDVFASVLEGDSKKAKLYELLFRDLYGNKDSVNRDYVLSKLGDFIQEQKLIGSISQAAQLIQRGDIAQARSSILQSLKIDEINEFNSGLKLDYLSKILEAISPNSKSFTSIGIPGLTEVNVGMAKKEILTFLAPTNKGKSWFLVHCGKHGILKGKKVLHVTLEMSEEKTGARYLQSLFSVARRKSEFQSARFNFEKGVFIGISFDERKRPTLGDAGISKKLALKLKRLSYRKDNLLIKQFPTHSLTPDNLKIYLDSLEVVEGFVPDILLIDYADLFKIDVSQIRVETGAIFKELRGLAVERNLAVVTATQTNVKGLKSPLVDLENFAEDFSKAMTSDVVITFSQTKPEERLNIGRLFVAKNRDDEAKRIIQIIQAYNIGQFCLDSMVMTSQKPYWDEVLSIYKELEPEHDYK